MRVFPRLFVKRAGAILPSTSVSDDGLSVRPARNDRYIKFRISPLALFFSFFFLVREGPCPLGASSVPPFPPSFL